jgi:hypothetical protein
MNKAEHVRRWPRPAGVLYPTNRIGIMEHPSDGSSVRLTRRGRLLPGDPPRECWQKLMGRPHDRNHPPPTTKENRDHGMPLTHNIESDLIVRTAAFRGYSTSAVSYAT